MRAVDEQRAAVVRLALAIASAAILYATLAAYWDMDIFQGDAVPYRNSRPWWWFVNEGRWLNWLLFPILKALNGTVALFLVLASLFLFAFSAARRYVEDSAFAFVFAALWIQAPPWTHQLQWPFVCVVPALALAAAALTVRKLPIYVFYVLFGVLMWSTMQHLYFVLPLLHVPLLTGASFLANVRILALRIVPAWLAGFLIGGSVSMLVVAVGTWFRFGVAQIGLVPSDWRKPNPVDSWGDLVANTINMLDAWLAHLADLLLPGTWWAWMTCGFGGLAFFLGMSGGLRNMPAKLAFVLITLSVYCAFIPFLGSFIQYRTGGVIAAMGLAALLFLSSCGRRRQVLIMGMAVCFSIAWSVQSAGMLRWYTGVNNLYRAELLRAVPNAPESYEGGIILINVDRIVWTALRGVSRKGIVALGEWPRVQAAGRAIGFRTALQCEDWNAAASPCKEVNERFADVDAYGEDPAALFTVPGEHKGALVVSAVRRAGRYPARR